MPDIQSTSAESCQEGKCAKEPARERQVVDLGVIESSVPAWSATIVFIIKPLTNPGLEQPPSPSRSEESRRPATTPKVSSDEVEDGAKDV
jgi:hypothetical protein